MKNWLKNGMTRIAFSRESVCMGDDANAGEYMIKMPDSATIGDLLDVIIHGGNGNKWPIPYTGANSFWVIKSDIGNLADVYTDKEGEWNVCYLAYAEETPLKPLGITRTFGARGLDPMDKRPSYNGYDATNMTGKEIKEYLSDAYSKVGPYYKQTAGDKIMIRDYKKIQDDKKYLVFYNDSFFKIMEAETGTSLYFITYTKEKPKRD